MSTHYITERNAKVFNREEILKCFASMIILSDDDVAEGRTLTETGVTLGVEVNGDCAWIAFDDKDCVTHFSTYGISTGKAIDFISDQLKLRLISEHDSDFDEHNFPVDVNTTLPLDEMDGWQLFEHGEYVYLYNANTKTFYPHICELSDEYDIETMISDAE